MNFVVYVLATPMYSMQPCIKQTVNFTLQHICMQIYGSQQNVLIQSYFSCNTFLTVVINNDKLRSLHFFYVE